MPEPGSLLPDVRIPPPGPRARELCRELERHEAPGINTLGLGDALLWESAVGSCVTDVDGNRYLDLTSGFGVAAVGHRHPRVVAAVGEQAASLLHGLADVHGHPSRVALASRVAALAPLPDPRVYFAVSGADAVEIALKTAALATGRHEVLAFEPAYHGPTLGALAVTSRPAFREPFEKRLAPHVLRLPFGAPVATIAAALGGRPAIGAVLVEPVVGREGVILPPEGWLAELAALSRRRDALLIADEIFTGLGRTGTLFAVERDGVAPDLLCCGKALGGGLPLAAVVGSARWMDAWRAPGEARHTATFVAHPLACAAALATLDLIDELGLVARAARLGEILSSRLAAAADHPRVIALRGRGALWGLELASAEEARRLVGRCLARGLLILAGGPDGRVVQFVPPLVITDEQLDVALEILLAALGEL